MLQMELFERECSVTLKGFQQEVTRWADRVFPMRTPDEILRKMIIEVTELVEDRVTPDEYADVLILVLDLASQHGIDIEQAVLEKMAVNERRKWARDPVTGTMQHIGD